VNVTWTQKEVHFWSRKSGKRVGALKVIDIAKTHTQITTIAFSHRFRLYMIVTADFKMYFLNELLKVVTHVDMSSIRLVNFAYFSDKDSRLITAGIDGVFIFHFNYQGKYAPLLAAQID
jgi:predicted phosphatase